VRKLNAGEVGDAVFAALDPAWQATVDVLGRLETPTLEPIDVRLVVQLQPLCVRVLAGAGPEAWEVVRWFNFPDGGAALQAACTALFAGVLAGHRKGAQVADYALAVKGEGGLVVEVAPALGDLRVLLVKPGQKLFEGVELGGIGECATAH
jgi:hypothetical protein